MFSMMLWLEAIGETPPDDAMKIEHNQFYKNIKKNLTGQLGSIDIYNVFMKNLIFFYQKAFFLPLQVSGGFF